jgi:hypothetical protein
MSWVAVGVGVAGIVVGGISQDRAADKAANAATKGNNAAIAEQRAAREQFQTNIAPFLDFGKTGISGLQALLANPDSIQDSAAYQWRFDQGMQGLDRTAAARGNMFGGGHQADVVKFGQGLASQEYGDQWNRLWNIATMGQNAAVGAGSAAQQSANAIGGYLSNNGAISASAYQQQGQNMADMSGALAGLINRGYQQNAAGNGGGSGWYVGNNPGRG